MIAEDYYSRRDMARRLLGGICVRCGTEQDLEFDHIDPMLKTHSVNKLLASGSTKLLNELAKCQLLCKACHLAKTVAEKEPFTHGTMYGWMRRKCGCTVCSGAKRAWYDLRNEKRRGLGTVVKGAYSKDPVHGTSAKYSRGCRCSECRAANADKERKRKKSKAII